MKMTSIKWSAIVIIVSIVTMIINSWVFTMLWAWYIVPAFSVQPLRMIFAFGIVLIIMAATAPRTTGNMDVTEAENMAKKIVNEANIWKNMAKEIMIKSFVTSRTFLIILVLGWWGSFFV